MSAHRFRAFSEQFTTSSASHVAAPAAFMPCPCPMLMACPPAQQSFIEAVYRLAQERTQAQLQPQRTRAPQFSLN